MLKMAKSVDISLELLNKETIDKQIQKIISKSEGLNYQEIRALGYNTIMNNRLIIARKISAQHPWTLFRIVPAYEGIEPEKQTSFHNPPPGKTQLNRANIEGHPVLYCSKDILTAFKEMKDLGLLDKEYYLGEWELSINSPINVLSMVMNSKSLQNDCLVSGLAHMQRNVIRKMLAHADSEIEEQLAYASQKVGDLFALPGPDYYNITSALVHCALYEMRGIGANITGVMYPSFFNNVEGLNFAFHPDAIEKGILRLKRVFRYRLPDDFAISSGLFFNIDGIGTPGEDGQIVWAIPRITVEIADISGIIFETYNGCRFTGQRALSLSILDTKETGQGLVEYWLNELLLVEVIKLHKSLNVRKSLIHDVCEEYCSQIDLKHGPKVITEKGISCIHHIYIPMKLQEFIADC